LKGNWVLAVVCASLGAFFLTGASVDAAKGDDDNGSFLCPVGQALTGIIFEDDDERLDFICGTAALPDIYLKTDSQFAFNDNPVDVTVGCDEGDQFISGSAWALPRDDATPLEIFINAPQVNPDTGEIEWRSTARYPDSSEGRDLVVSVICLDTNP